jgi:hypothetical protein
VAEGQFLYSRNQVRWQLARPGNTQTYFSKVEVAVGIDHDSDPGPAIATAKQLLSEALPVLLRDHFPENEQIQRK